MLQAVSGLTASAIVLRGHEPLDEPLTTRLDAYIERRRTREPLQHILGESSFMGLKFLVDKRVLIPRPETEMLVEAAQQVLQEKLAAQSASSVRFLDIGAGSGAIALSLLHLCPKVSGVAWEISPDAAAVCETNARALGVLERLDLQIGDFFQKVTEFSASVDMAKSNERFDLFVSNPPYIAAELMAGLEPEVRDFEPHLALLGQDPDGLGFYRAFSRSLPDLAAANGATLLAEFGEGQGQSIKAIFEEGGWSGVQLVTDLSGKDRIVIASLPGGGSQGGL